MKHILNFNFILIALISATTLFNFTGCKKKHDTIVKIHVRDASNSPVSDANVRLYVKVTGGMQTPVLDKSATTNSSGDAIFNFNDVYKSGQAGVAVLDIKAMKDGLVGEGIIKIEEEKTSEETVFI